MDVSNLLNNNLFIAIIWVAVVAASFGFAAIWMTYLIKIVMNDEEVQEKLRRHRRISEEIMRAEESSHRAA